jgi:hypothetical protein
LGDPLDCAIDNTRCHRIRALPVIVQAFDGTEFIEYLILGDAGLVPIENVGGDDVGLGRTATAMVLRCPSDERLEQFGFVGVEFGRRKQVAETFGDGLFASIERGNLLALVGGSYLIGQHR